MKSIDIRKATKAWATRIGVKEAIKRLVAADIDVSIVQKLVSGRYESEPSFERAQRILAEIVKDEEVVAS